MDMPADASGRRLAVVVVHGVGNNYPGSTVNAVADAICDDLPQPAPDTITHRRRVRGTPENDVYFLPEPDTTGEPGDAALAETDAQASAKPARAAPASVQGSVRRFPVYGRQTSLAGNGSADLYELHWADLARGDQSWWTTAKSFARFIFEIPHVIDGFLREPPGPYSRLLRRILLLATCFIRGPLAGYTAVMLAGGLIFLSFSWLPEREDVYKVVTVVKEQFADLVVKLLSEGSRGSLDRLFAYLPETHSRQWLLAWMVGLFSFGMVLCAFGRSKLRVLFLGLFLVLTSGLYLTDALYLRPARYSEYVGIVYLDYMSVGLFAVFMVGLYVFLTHRIKEAGFADLGLFVALWSFFFIFHLSSLGDLTRQWLFGAKPFIVTTVKTPSSTVHFEVFSLYFPYLAYLWVFWAVLMLVAFVMAILLYLANWFRWHTHYRGVFAALGLAVAQSCVWLTAIPALGVMHMDDVLCRGAKNYASVQQPVSCQTKLDVNNQSVDLLLRLHVLPEESKKSIPPYLLREIENVLADRKPFTLNIDMLNAMRDLSLAFVWNGFTLLAALALAVAVALYRHIKSRMFGAGNTRVRLPRLIINNWILAFLLLFGLLNITFAFVRFDSQGPINDVLAFLGLGAATQREVPAEVVKMAIMSTTLFLIITQIPAVMTPLSGVLQILQGLIDHHYRIGVSLAPRLMARRPDDPIRRDHINQRLHELVSRLIAPQGYDEVVFLAHSQGTVIVYDYLRSNQAGIIDKPVHVLTAGSPLGALYAYYFNEYDRVAEVMDKLKPSVVSWNNLYRLDDPIAGPIGQKGRPFWNRHSEQPTALPHFLRNTQLPPGGHLRYWSEPIVRQAIRNILLGAVDRCEATYPAT